ncbi:MAG: chemotaxis protein CheR [Deltaproteobacteria bacterium]|nr:chemotaxis protein CheR [Deltaproteobacteria bacterium]
MKSSGARPSSTLHPMPAMSPREFAKFSEFISKELGIKISDKKQGMLQARLQKRLRILALPSFTAYCEYLFSLKGMEIELPHLVDAVTTNTTEFFREPKHFDYMNSVVLPEFIARGDNAPMAIWSAGCSSGEEPYTLAIVLNEFKETRAPRFRFGILATDISREILEKAMRAVYTEERVEKIPYMLKKKYLLRSKERSRGLVRIVPELRKLVHFRQLNFMEDFGFRETMHVIFCRNVMIYFDRPTQERLINRFCEHLDVGGYLFIGHSESLTGLRVPLIQSAPTVYRRIKKS